MNPCLLVVSPDAALRTQVSAIAGAERYVSLDFQDGHSAFLFACSRAESLAAALIDETLKATETETLLRRLGVLCPELPAILLTRADSSGSHSASGSPSTDDRQEGGANDGEWERPAICLERLPALLDRLRSEPGPTSLLRKVTSRRADARRRGERPGEKTRDASTPIDDEAHPLANESAGGGSRGAPPPVP